MIDLKPTLYEKLSQHPSVLQNIDRKEMIRLSVENKEVVITENGALATWTPPESTGRSPKDTVIVKRELSAHHVDWTSPNNLPTDEETFEMVFEDALEILGNTGQLFETDRVIGADSRYALPVKVITDMASHTLFADNMFRTIPEDLNISCFADNGFVIISLPYNKLDPERYEGRLRKMPNGKTSNMIVSVDLDRRIGIIIGSAYMGSLKKLLFTIMNYLLPFEGILPLHCSANEGDDGNSDRRFIKTQLWRRTLRL
jgi:phosphoenolpyruvate carboxykinase (ATP)